MAGSFASWVLGSFVVEGRCGSSIAPCIGCLTALVERTPGRLEAAIVGTAVVVGPGIAPVGIVASAVPAELTDLGTELAAPGIASAALDIELAALGPEPDT